jgi:hypothetical protein
MGVGGATAHILADSDRGHLARFAHCDPPGCGREPVPAAPGPPQVGSMTEDLARVARLNFVN